MNDTNKIKHDGNILNYMNDTNTLKRQEWLKEKQSKEPFFSQDFLIGLILLAFLFFALGRLT